MYKKFQAAMVPLILAANNAMASSSGDTSGLKEVMSTISVPIMIIATGVGLWYGLPKIMEGAKALDRREEGMMQIVSGVALIGAGILISLIAAYFGFSDYIVDPRDI